MDCLRRLVRHTQRDAGPAAPRPQTSVEAPADAYFPLAALRHIFGRPAEPAQSAHAAPAAAGLSPDTGTVAPDAPGRADAAATAQTLVPGASVSAEENRPSEPHADNDEDPAAANTDVAEGESQAKAVRPMGPDAAHGVAESAPADAEEAHPVGVKICSRCASPQKLVFACILCRKPPRTVLVQTLRPLQLRLV